MRYFKSALILLALFVAACSNDGISTDSNGQQIFTYAPLGWQTAIPDGWQALESHELDKLAYKAENYYEEDSRSKNDEKKIIFGIHKVEKDMNALYAFIREVPEGEDAPELADLLQQQYRQYSTDNYTAEKSLTTETINGKSFEVAILSVQYNGKPYFNYITYSTMIGNTNFGASIVANNQEDENMLRNSFTSSVKTIKYTADN